MRGSTHGMLVIAMAAWVSLLAPARAGMVAVPLSMAVIEASITGVGCTLTSPDGAKMNVPCEASGWMPTLGAGWSADMVATIAYSYHDDGLALSWDGQSARPYWLYLGHNGYPILYPDFESAAIYVDTYPTTNGCFSRYGLCPERYRDGVHFTGHQTYPPIFLSSNDFAEDVNGELLVTTGARYEPVGQFGPGVVPSWSPTVFMDLRTQVISVAAVPEPSTWALMIGPLLGFALLAHRRAVLTSP
jgi:hypothetical protein